MFDFPSRQAAGPQSQALHFSYEKAGMVLDNQPIPWNAEAVLVEAQMTYSPQRARLRDDYQLRLAGSGQVVAAENIRTGDRPDLCRVFFRFPVPVRTTAAEILWRGKSKGQLTLQILQEEDFLKHLSLQMPTLSMQLEDQTMQCQTAVTSQCQSIVLTVQVSSATSLAPIVDLGLRVRMLTEKGDVCREAPIHFSSSQLRGRQVLAAAVLPRPRRGGTWIFHWLLDDKVLAQQRLETVSQSAMQRSLRLSATRFVLQYPDGRMCLTRTLPNLEEVERVGPCFWLSSSLPGLGGWCDVEMRTRFADDKREPLSHRQRVLLSDGPTAVPLGTFDAASLHEIKHFELRCRNRSLGILPLEPVPVSTFNAEGGFAPAEDFSWSPAADELLQEKLSRLLG